jgi:hypothetical protein
MALTKATYSMINGAPVNVLDYGADNTGITDSAAAFNAAFAASTTVYVPRGTYLVNSSINVPSAGTLFGENKTNTVIRAGTLAQNVISLPQSNYNVRIRRLGIDCNSLASQGIVSLSTTFGEAAHLLIEDVEINNSIGKNINLKFMAYAVLRDVYSSNIAANGIATGLFLENCANCEIHGGLYYNNRQASAVLFKTTTTLFLGARFYNDAAVVSPTLMELDSSFNNSIVDCTFEPQGAANVVTNISLVGTTGVYNCTDNNFINCKFIGLTNTCTNVIAVGTANAAYKTKIQNCTFIKPTSTSSILLTNQADTLIENCADLINYDTPTYANVSVTNNSGNAYSIKTAINGANSVNPLTTNTGTVGNASLKWSSVAATSFLVGTSSVTFTSDTGSPEGALTAIVGSLYTRTNGGSGTTLYIKESGTGNTGWVAK